LQLVYHAHFGRKIDAGDNCMNELVVVTVVVVTVVVAATVAILASEAGERLPQLIVKLIVCNL